MSPKVRIIVYSCLASALAVVLLVGLIMAHHRPLRTACSELSVQIIAPDDSAYMTRDEVVQLLMQNDVYPVGRPLDQIAVASMERTVTAHPMVRTAECYLTQGGVCRVVITQRTPVYRVTTGAEAYLIDADRKRMPLRSTMHLSLLSATGRIGERMASQELYDLMTYLSDSRFWRNLVARVEVSSPQMTALVLRDNRRVILGPIADYEAKLDRLRTMWKATEDYPEAQAEVYDLRYDQQVITRKNQ